MELTLKSKYIKGAAYSGLLLCALFSVFIVCLLELSNRGNIGLAFDFLMNNPPVVAINIIIAFAVTSFFYSLFQRVWAASFTVLLISWLMGFVNMSKFKYQGQPFLPWDIFLFRDAARVMPHMKNEFIDSSSIRFIIAGLVLLIICILFYFGFDRHQKGKRPLIKSNLILYILVLILSSSIIFSVSTENKYRAEFFNNNKIVNYFWDQTQNYQINGLLLGFTVNISNIVIKKPLGYSQAKLEDIKNMLNSYSIKGEIKPDIVVIMSESFADVTKIKGLEFSKDPLEKFREIGRKGLMGEVYVPVLGGKTANTEFEFLTGYNVKHLPEGSVPYQQHITTDINSLAGYLKKIGYTTTAIHNNIPEFWNRKKVYEYMGFDRFVSIEDFKDPVYYGSWIRDKDMLDKIKATLEKESEDEPQFIFAVTVQNHAPYDVPSEAEQIHVTGDLSDEDREIMQRYAAGVNITDKELYNLYNYIDERKRPTILCYFGDHLPGGFSMYRTHPYFTSMKAGTSRKDMFATPYIIWSNYKEEPEIKDLGINGLSGRLLEYSEADVPGFFAYVTSIYEDADKAEENYFSVKDMDEKLKDFKDTEFEVMYDDMFGKKYLQNN